MITGLNSDVKHEGCVFHVQTEEKGRSNPVIESLVYVGGEIVASIRVSYADLAASADYSRDRLLRRLRKQHLSVIGDIRNGRFKPPPKLIGDDRITTTADRSLDELVVDRLKKSIRDETRQRGGKYRPGAPAVVGRRQRTRTKRQEPVQRARPERPRPAAVAIENNHKIPAWVWGASAAALVLGAVLLFMVIEAPPRSTVASVAAQTEGSGQTGPTSTALDTARSRSEKASTTEPEEAETAESRGTGGSPEPEPSVSTESVARRAEVPERPMDDAAPLHAEPQTKADPPKTAATTLPDPDEGSFRPPQPAGPTLVATPVQPQQTDSQPLPAVWTGKLLDYSAVDVPPRPTKRDLPGYTSRARKRRQEGMVELDLLVDENGNVATVKLVRGIPNSDLNEAAIDAARTWKYTPARKDGYAVRVWKTAALHFSLSRQKVARVAIRE